MSYGDFKDLTRRTASDKVLPDKAFDISKNPKHDGYQCGVVSMAYTFLHNKSTGTCSHKRTGTGINLENQQLAKGLHKPNIKAFDDV